MKHKYILTSILALSLCTYTSIWTANNSQPNPYVQGFAATTGTAILALATVENAYKLFWFFHEKTDPIRALLSPIAAGIIGYFITKKYNDAITNFRPNNNMPRAQRAEYALNLQKSKDITWATIMIGTIAYKIWQWKLFTA